MRIEINNNDTKTVRKLIKKILELNDNGDYDYLDNDILYLGFNETSGFSYIYLDSSPSISLCVDNCNKICIVYNSGLDGIEFVKYNLDDIDNLSILEDTMNDCYDLEGKIRGNDYEDSNKKDKFIEEMISKGWDEL